VNDLSVEDQRILDRLPDQDQIVIEAARIEADLVRVQSGQIIPQELATQYARERVKLRQSAIRDELTKAWSRHYMSGILHHELRSEARNTSGLGVLFADIDDFKQVNDELGHEIGDKVLIELAKILAEVCGSMAEVGRWGGEEWLVVYSGATPDNLRELGLKLGNEVEERLAAASGLARGKVTVSIGATMANRGELAKDLVDKADQAMYKAKELGRNRMVVAGEKEEVIEFGS
jgi:diguanylate cyclase (GGDEF)-like protein